VSLDESQLEEVVLIEAFANIVGNSPALQKSLSQVKRVAPTSANVLIEGESGTGKELVARALHEQSARRTKPLIKVNCGAIPRELFESEFFGHMKGAFTGAIRDRVGRFQLADGGTLFLDEVGEIPLDLQSKLLRVLQEGEFERIGDDRTRMVDVRVIAATNRKLEAEAKAGRFRTDLYFRLSVFPIEIPALRDRLEDVTPLARHFLTNAANRHGLSIPELRPEQTDALLQYAWPGNVRELQHVVERSVICHRTGPFQFMMPQVSTPPPGPSNKAGPQSTGRPGLIATGVASDADIRAGERANVERALTHCRFRIHGPNGAAALLGLKPTTLLSRMKAMGLNRERLAEPGGD
jgi:transcriptional regulator with GAF, ATPase, and Fis domain